MKVMLSNENAVIVIVHLLNARLCTDVKHYDTSKDCTVRMATQWSRLGQHRCMHAEVKIQKWKQGSNKDFREKTLK